MPHIIKVHVASHLFMYTAGLQMRENREQTKTLHSFLTSWHNSILGYKLRSDQEQLRLKIFKKLITSSLNSEFTDSYEKKCNCLLDHTINWVGPTAPQSRKQYFCIYWFLLMHCVIQYLLIQFSIRFFFADGNMSFRFLKL